MEFQLLMVVHLVFSPEIIDSTYYTFQWGLWVKKVGLKWDIKKFCTTSTTAFPGEPNMFMVLPPLFRAIKWWYYSRKKLFPHLILWRHTDIKSLISMASRKLYADCLFRSCWRWFEEMAWGQLALADDNWLIPWWKSCSIFLQQIFYDNARGYKNMQDYFIPIDRLKRTLVTG